MSIGLLSFGVAGMAAALEIDQQVLREAVANGEVAAPDFVLHREPRWWPENVFAEVLRLHGPKNPDEHPAVLHAQALARADAAEGWHSVNVPAEWRRVDG